MPAMPWWAMLLVMIVLPILQPVTQYGSNKLQKTLGVESQPDQQQQQQQQQLRQPVAANNKPQPYIVYHNGQWWKFENNQWYVWSQTTK